MRKIIPIMVLVLLLPRISHAVLLEPGHRLDFTFSVPYINKIDLMHASMNLGLKDDYNFDIWFRTAIYNDNYDGILINTVHTFYSTNATNVYVNLFGLEDYSSIWTGSDIPGDLQQFNDGIGSDVVRGSISVFGGSVDFDWLHLAFLTASEPPYNNEAVGHWYNVTNYEIIQGHVVPEPSTILLLGSGLVGLVGFRRRFKK